jgi:hypothetical protein
MTCYIWSVFTGSPILRRSESGNAIRPTVHADAGITYCSKEMRERTGAFVRILEARELDCLHLSTKGANSSKLTNDLIRTVNFYGMDKRKSKITE